MIHPRCCMAFPHTVLEVAINALSFGGRTMRYVLISTRILFFFSSRRRHTRFDCDWSSDVCSSDLTYSYSAAVVEVEVNPITGWVHVPKVWIAHDIGRALNPTLVRGQVEGSVYKIGRASCRERV